MNGEIESKNTFPSVGITPDETFSWSQNVKQVCQRYQKKMHPSFFMYYALLGTISSIPNFDYCDIM